jgi:hypothetical protein
MMGRVLVWYWWLFNEDCIDGACQFLVETMREFESERLERERLDRLELSPDLRRMMRRGARQ